MSENGITCGTTHVFKTTIGTIEVWAQINGAGDPSINGKLEARGYTYPMGANHPRGCRPHHVRFGDPVSGFVGYSEAEDPHNRFWQFYANALRAAETSRGSEYLDLASAIVVDDGQDLPDFKAHAWRGSKASAASEKPRPSLVPAEALTGAVRALDLGATKYGANNWREIPLADFERLYRDAFLRHVLAAWSGEAIDMESGNAHLDHALACLLLLRARGVDVLGCSERGGSK